MKESTFPWLLANIIEKETGKPLAGAEPTCIIDHAGVKVGLIGIAEQEWITTLATVSEDQLNYEVRRRCRLNTSG